MFVSKEPEKLNPEIKAKWIEALRSDRYIQAREVLYDSEVHDKEGPLPMCCLGVLEHVCGAPLEEFPLKGHEDQYLDNMTVRNYSPINILDQLWNNGTFETTIQKKLANMNDSGLSFEEIAEFIEKNL